MMRSPNGLQEAVKNMWSATVQKRTREQGRMKQLQTSYIAEESTLLSPPGSEDAAPSASIAALTRARKDAA
jgi:hypothetical protein